MKMYKCKGMADLLPSDMVKFRRVEEAFRHCCLERGYEEIRTPTLEYLHLFTASGTLTPDMLGRVYSFLDWDGWSGERVVLRPDGTIPAARLFLEQMPAGGTTRLFYVENTFRFEETGMEPRERWQCSAELIGSDLALADVELILIARDTLARLGIGPLTVKLSHAGLIKALLAELGLGEQQQAEVFNRMLEGDPAPLHEKGTQDPNLARCLDTLLHVRGESPSYLANVRAMLGSAVNRFEASLNGLASIAELLGAMSCPYEIDVTSGRGFEYYTGVMFQFYVAEQRVGGGGRYDDLIPLVGGPPTPASGLALYMDRLMDMLQDARTSENGVLIRPQTNELGSARASLEIAAALRHAGYTVQLDLDKAMAPGYRWILSVSEQGGFRLTDLSTGKEHEALSQTMLLELMEGPP